MQQSIEWSGAFSLVLWTGVFALFSGIGTAVVGFRVALWPRVRPKVGRPWPRPDRATLWAGVGLSAPVVLVWPYLAVTVAQAALLGMLCLLLAAQVGHDLRRGLLPLEETVLIALAGGVAVWLQMTDPFDAALGSITGVGILFLLDQLWRRGGGVRAVGGGDMSLIAALGIWSGLSGLSVLLIVAALSALGVAWITGTRGRIAFGPYLVLGTWAVVLVPLWLG
ncbi:prepilin peptidase [uncultured Roseobacter sp.]|uniref:prepilin peptidase n=1 Tax=uncultured Roseobacter sp. TaxID=114847 RepID=UPI002633E878|nr:prepilin peptidase [uncultured Roseobacter sp.]